MQDRPGGTESTDSSEKQVHVALRDPCRPSWVQANLA